MCLIDSQASPKSGRTVHSRGQWQYGEERQSNIGRGGQVWPCFRGGVANMWTKSKVFNMDVQYEKYSYQVPIDVLLEAFSPADSRK